MPAVKPLARQHKRSETARVASMVADRRHLEQLPHAMAFSLWGDRRPRTWRTSEVFVPIGFMIEHHRNRRGWTIATLARRAGISVLMLRRLEHHDPLRMRRLTDDELLALVPAIAAALDTTVEALLAEQATDLGWRLLDWAIRLRPART